MNRKEIIEILRVGLKAASPYNLQPWTFQFLDGRLLIFAQYRERGFSYHFTDCIFYSLGCLLENLSQGAKHYQYEMIYSLLNNDADRMGPVCQVSFEKVTTAEDHDISHVMSRYTNRKLYSDRNVHSNVLERISSFFQGKTRKVRDITKNRTMIDACALLERVRILNSELSSEFFGSIFFCPKNDEGCHRGLDSRVLQVPFLTIQFLWMCQNKYFRQTMGRSLFAQIIAEKGHAKLLRHSPLLIAFEEQDQSPEVLVRDWMDIQRIINDLHREGLSSHLIASGVDLAKIDPAFSSAKENAILDLARSNVQEKMGISLKKTLTLLRVGYAEDCLVKSLRVDPEDLLLPENS